SPARPLSPSVRWWMPSRKRPSPPTTVTTEDALIAGRGSSRSAAKTRAGDRQTLLLPTGRGLALAGDTTPAQYADRTSPELRPNSHLKARLRLQASANHKFPAIAEIDCVPAGSVRTAYASRLAHAECIGLFLRCLRR